MVALVGDGLPLADLESDAACVAWPGVHHPLNGRPPSREDVAAASTLHVAAHASFDPAHPLESSLRVRGGKLGLEDVLSLRLRASVAFVSACTTGLPAPLTPDEGLCLGHALNRAGVSDVIATGWPVADAAAAAVSVHFYEELCEGRAAPSVALQRAQQRVRDGTGPSCRLTSRYLPRIGLDGPAPIVFWAAFLHSSG